MQLSACKKALVAARLLGIDTKLNAATGFEAAPLNPLIIAHISEAFLDIRSLQKPLKDQYRQDPASSVITLTARGTQTDAPISCSVDLGRQIYQAQAHKGVGGAGTGACSGDLLLGALAACAQITCQMVAAAMGIPTEGIDVTVEGDLDLKGTLGNFQRCTRRVSEHQGHFRCSRTAGHPGTVKRIAGEDRTVLRRDADLAAPPNHREQMGAVMAEASEPRHAAL